MQQTHQLKTQKYKYLKINVIIAILILGVVVLIIKRYKAKNKQIERDKNEFVNTQMKNYDQRILQMLIVKAEYEEIKAKLKKDFGLGDEDIIP